MATTNIYPASFTEREVCSKGDVSLVSGVFTLIGEYIVKADEYVVLGMGFGILLKVNGYGILWALAMSVFIFAGSMQFVGISLITGGASLLSTALTTLMVWQVVIRQLNGTAV